jgi:hypothetical protein
MAIWRSTGSTPMIIGRGGRRHAAAVTTAAGVTGVTGLPGCVCRRCHSDDVLLSWLPQRRHSGSGRGASCMAMASSGRSPACLVAGCRCGRERCTGPWTACLSKAWSGRTGKRWWTAGCGGITGSPSRAPGCWRPRWSGCARSRMPPTAGWRSGQRDRRPQRGAGARVGGPPGRSRLGLAPAGASGAGVSGPPARPGGGRWLARRGGWHEPGTPLPAAAACLSAGLPGRPGRGDHRDLSRPGRPGTPLAGPGRCCRCAARRPA